MRVLFDNGTPRGLAAFLAGHSVEEARLQTVISSKRLKALGSKFW